MKKKMVSILTAAFVHLPCWLAAALQTQQKHLPHQQEQHPLPQTERQPLP